MYDDKDPSSLHLHNMESVMEKPDWSRQGQAQEFGPWFMDLGLMTKGYQLDHSLSL